VTDVLPAGVTFLSTTAVCNSGTLGTGCNIGSLASGASTFFTIQVKVASNASSAISNTATVSSDQLDPDLSDNTSTVITNVVQSADLRVTKTCKPDTSPAPAGSTAICTIQVDNLGPSDASNVSLTDNIVSNTTLTITFASPFFCSGIPVSAVSSASLTCNLGTQPAGSSVTETVSFTAVNGGDINDTAAISSSTPDPNASNNSATGKVTFASSADLSITKTAAPNPSVIAGTNLTYTITASNAAGPSTATNVVVKDTLPGQVSVVSVTPSVGSCSGGVPGNPAQPLICTLGSLIKGASATITVVVNVNLNTPNGTILTNNASISSDTSDPTNNNNTALVNTTVNGGADLSVTKTSGPTPVVAGTNLTYTITAHNAGPATATNVIVKDTLPGQVAVGLVTPSQGSCSGGIPGNPAQPLTCTLGQLLNGGTATITVVVKVNSSTPDATILINNASISSDITDPNNANNVATVNSPVVAQADLAILKTSDKPQYKPTSTITYTIKVTNNGPSDALAVVVTDNLPSIKRAHYQSDTGGCTITLTTNVLTCNLGTMPTGTTKSFNIYELINGNKGNISNTASVTSPTTDLAPGNNTTTLVVGVK
jgi:uncharacterized repeat protein (TIGR01451 family)